MTAEAVLSLVFSIITAITAVVAIFISIIQVRKSNKQSLFERRLRTYLTTKWMKSLCDENSTIAKEYIKDAETDLLLSIDFLFILMTNCTFLEEIGPAITNTIENKELHRKYLLKIEELRNMCEEVQLIFPDDIGHQLADFIFYYEEMLIALFKYKVAIDSIRQECRPKMEPLRKDDEFENKVRKEAVKYISGTFELAERLTLDGIFDKARKTIRL